jgi:hypothetical protein
MSLIVPLLVLTLSLLVVRLLILPFDLLTGFSLPTWFYFIGAVALFSWCLGD